MNLAAWDKLLTATPDDWVSRAVYADWLEDEGLSVLSAGQRWQVAHKRYPAISMQSVSIGHNEHLEWVVASLAPPTWMWYKHNFLPHGYYTVTPQVWSHLSIPLRHLAFHHRYYHIIYSTRHRAEEALAYALAGELPHAP